MSKVWLISDTHFFHEKIISMCNRPYTDAQHMNSQLIKNWNYWINEQDIVYHLGDFGLGSKEQLKSIVDQLNGRINLIAGNHDRYKPTDYQAMGFIWVSRFPIIFNKYMILSHEPLNLSPNGQFVNVHGHSHNSTPLYNNRTLNVSVENTKYLPISLNRIEHLLKYEQDDVTEDLH